MERNTRVWIIASIAVLCVAASACTSQMAMIPHVKEYVDKQDFDAALAEIERIDRSTSRLLYLYEKGLVLHYGGRYEESNSAFEEAEHLYEDLYTKSLAREAGALLTSDNVLEYRGERFESALIHYYKLLNYLYLSDPEDALVECRKINNKLRAFRDTGDSVYPNDPFLQYLTGIVFLDEGESSDADVSFRAAMDAYTGLANRYRVEIPSTLRCDLVRCSELIGDETAVAEYSDSAEACDEPARDKGSGSLNIFLECGHVSYKIEQNIVFPIYKDEINHDTDIDEFSKGLALRYGQPVDRHRKLDYLLRVALPAMVPSPEPFVDAAIRVQVAGHPRSARAQVVENLDALSQEAFEARWGGIMLKTIARALTKYLAKEGADDKGVLAGVIVNLFNIATESADTRCWATLPQTIRMARLELPEGRYDVEIVLDGDMSDREESYFVRGIEVTAGRSTFANFRVN